jgi:sarcosine oxidase delta subunit
MGAFNTVITEVQCPVCNERGRFEVQYKYGDTWQHQYDIGSVIRWGGNDIGRPKMKKVIVEGIGGPCPHCQTDNIEFDVVVESDQLKEVCPLGLERKEHYPDGFLVLEE